MQLPDPGADDLPRIGDTDPGHPDLGDVVERFDHLALAVADVRSALPLVDLLGGVYGEGPHHVTLTVSPRP